MTARYPMPHNRTARRFTAMMLLVAVAIGLTAVARFLPAQTGETGSSTSTATEPAATGVSIVPDTRQQGGECDSIVQVANLVYAGTKSSQCFSDHFLVRAQRESAISTSRRFHAVKLGGDAIFQFPLLIMTGEGTFRLSDHERDYLRRYIQRGGFLLASAGCSSQEWDRSFRTEMAAIFPDQRMRPIGMDHPIFNTVYKITQIKAAHGQSRPIEGITVGGRMGVVYSRDGLNDTEHTTGCCCCGGNEIRNAIEINVNILAYALTY